MTRIPTLVSFSAGDRYYHEAAQLLRADCERLGVPHDIVERADTDGLDWAAICRLKITFWREMLAKHGPILWLDVDARLLRPPEVLAGCRFDLAGFVGRYRYLRDYNPFDTARFWVPSVLMFNDTPSGRAFVELMSEIERDTAEDVTDDYVLQEAWARYPGQLNLGVLAPQLAVRSRESAEHAVFLLGDSGNVGGYRDRVLQHDNASADVRLRATVLSADAVDAMKAGDQATALVLAERAAAHQPDDVAVVQRYAEYLRRSRRVDDALRVIRAFLDRNPDSAPMRNTLDKHAATAAQRR